MTPDLSHVSGRHRLSGVVISGPSNDTLLDMRRLRLDVAMLLLHRRIVSGFTALAGHDRVRGDAAVQ